MHKTGDHDAGTTASVDTAFEALARQDWAAARDALLCNGADDLTPQQLDLLSRATWFLGDVPASITYAERAFNGYLRADDPTPATRLGLVLTMLWGTRGDLALAGAWLGRSRHLLQEAPPSALSGYLAYVEMSSADIDGDPAPAEDAVAQVDSLRRQFDDPALESFAQVLRGVAAIRGGHTADGFECLDAAMLPVIAGQVDPVWAGDIYCSVIHVCEGLGDLARMRAWTDALDRWAAPLAESFVYAYVTRVHRLQLFAAEGDWERAESELGELSHALIGAHGWLAGAGYTELGDIRRLRGDLAGARDAYEKARGLGMPAQPGHALLLRDSGDPEAGLDDLRSSLAEHGRLGRGHLLLAAVQLALHLGHTDAAAHYADELAQSAAFFCSPGLTARADQAAAAVAVAQGRATDALEPLGRAAAVYRSQRFRYGIAQVHEQLGTTHCALGDYATSAAEYATAVTIYRQLGAVPDADRLEQMVLGAHEPPGGLTTREAEVLKRVAAGESNRQVASGLFISDKTVGRHLANIYLKLGVSSRTAAAAWAHGQKLD